MNIYNDNANGPGPDDVKDLDSKQKIDHFTQKICSFLNELRRTKSNELCADNIMLVTEDTRNIEISAHKVVSGSVSRYFFTKFTKYDEIVPRVCIKGFESSTLESIIEYSHSNNITINEDNVEVILHAAYYFCMENLKNVCCNFLLKTPAVRNCFRICSIADLYKCKLLQTSCDNFIKQNFAKIIKDERFLDLPLNCLLTIIQDDDLNVPSEMMVYTAVISWVKYNLEERKKHLYQLISHVRLPFLGKYRLVRLCSEPLFEDTADVQKLLSKAFVDEWLLSTSLKFTLDRHMPIPRTSYSYSYSSIPKMFTIGGYNNGPSQTVDYLNIRDEMWHSVMQLRKGLYGAAAVSTRNKIYVTGGYSSNGASSMEIFDIKTEKWIKSVPMLSYRAYHAAVLLYDRIYVIGGINSNNRVLRSVEYFCLEENDWYSIQDMMEPRVHCAAAVLNGKIYVTGGSRKFSHLQPSKLVECFDPTEAMWGPCRSMNYARYGHGAAVVNSEHLLYVVGGQDNGDCNTVEAYNMMTDNWESMPKLLVPRLFHGICYENGFVFAVGGRWNDSYMSSIEMFCCDTKEWATMSVSTESTIAKSHLSVVMAYESPN